MYTLASESNYWDEHLDRFSTDMQKTHVCATRRDRYQMAFTVGPFVGLDAVGKVKVTAAGVITSTDSPSNRGGS